MPPRRNRGDFGPKELLRILIVVLGWIGFVWMWVLVGRRPWDTSGLVWLIVGTLIIAPLLTLAWVLHNRAIFRRKGERKLLVAADCSYRSDWHGRSVSADWAQLQRSRFVTVDLDADSALKSYRCQDSELGRGILEPDPTVAANTTQYDTGSDEAVSRH